MTWITTIDETEASDGLREAYDKVKSSRGRVSNIFKVHSLNPKVMKAHVDLYLSVMFEHEGLTRRQREMVAVVVSSLNECQYCVAHHSAALARYVTQPGFLGQLEAGFRKTNLEDREKAMLEYAEKLTRLPNSITLTDIENLRKYGFSDIEILQLNLVTSYFCFVNRVASGLGVELEEDKGEGYKY